MPLSTTRARHRFAGVVGGVALAAAIALAGAPASAAPGDEHLAGLEYVALGDSYAAGYGLTPSTGLPVAGCDQSTLNYPHQVATELGLSLTDITCSGAVADNVISTDQTTYSGIAPAQLLELSASTDIVTVTIGGNDLGFVEILTNCAYDPLIGGVVVGGPNCTAHYNPGGVDSLAAAIDGTVTTALNDTFAAIALAAPNAKVFVIGYPSLTPSTLPSGGCFSTALGSPFPVNAYPYQDVDVAYLHTVEVRLDQAIADAAVANGAIYVSNLAATDLHTPCADAPDAFVNGITVTAVNFGPPLTVDLAPGAMHPNAAGVAFFATQAEAAIRAAFPPPPPTAPAGGLADSGVAGAGWIALSGVLLLLAGIGALRVRRIALRG